MFVGIVDNQKSTEEDEAAGNTLHLQRDPGPKRELMGTVISPSSASHGAPRDAAIL